MIYLLTIEDTHCDNEYKGFLDPEEAKKAAEIALANFMGHYDLDDSDIDRTEYGCLLWAAFSPCGSFSITVQSIEVVR